jgi:hypothetical protein
MLLVYVRRALMPHVRDIQADTLGIGVLGVGVSRLHHYHQLSI